MALPGSIRVKLSSEAAGAISITPVVVQEIPTRELIEHLLAVAGKDAQRIREILLRGSVVSGASRFRWAGWEAEMESLLELLATFPDDDPTLPFTASRCTRAILRGGLQTVDIPREAASRKTLFQKETFWYRLMALVAQAAPGYTGYSYRERADRFRRPLTATECTELRTCCDAVRFSTLRDQIAVVAFTEIELYVLR